MIKITTKLDFEKYLRLMYVLTYRKPMMILLTVLGLLMFTVSILFFLGVEIPFNDRPYFPLFFGLFTILLPLFIYRNAKKNFASHGRLQEQIIYEFDEQIINIIGESFKSEMDWSKLHRIEELDNWILIYQNRLIANIIPKQAFGDNLIDFKKLAINKKINTKFQHN